MLGAAVLHLFVANHSNPPPPGKQAGLLKNDCVFIPAPPVSAVSRRRGQAGQDRLPRRLRRLLRLLLLLLRRRRGPGGGPSLLARAVKNMEAHIYPPFSHLFYFWNLSDSEGKDLSCFAISLSSTRFIFSKLPLVFNINIEFARR